MARQGVGPRWRARSVREILLSLETKGLLCVMISGWGGAGRGEMVYGNENEILWGYGGERDKPTRGVIGTERDRLRSQFSQANFGFVLHLGTQRGVRQPAGHVRTSAPT